MGRKREHGAYDRGARVILKSRKGSAFGTFIFTLLLVVAIGVFAYSGWRLLGYYMAYKEGSDEYSELNDDFIDLSGGQGESSGGAGGAKDPSAGQAASENGTAGRNASAQTEGAGERDVTQTEADEAQTETEKDGKVLSDVTALEDPVKAKKLITSARRETVTENQETKELPALVNPVNFEELQAINPEVIGWIRVGAVNISYPVAKAADNEYYLHRTFKKVDNFAGCIFENADNSPYFTDQNTIIYGHNMKNGSMFGQLKEFAKQETYDKNPYFWMFTKDFIYQYQIFASSVVNKIGDPYIIRFSKEDYQKFLDKSIASSEIKCPDAEVTVDDRIMTLSTCTGNDSTRRIVQGVLVQIYAAK